MNHPAELSRASGKLRLLAILAGCFSAIFGAPAFGAIFLILGAAIQPRVQTAGKWLMWLGAMLLSMTVLRFGPGVVFEMAGDGLESHGSAEFKEAEFWLVVWIFLVATVLVLWCDVALVWDALKAKQDVAGQPSPSLAWVAWIVAILLTLWSFRGAITAVRAHQLHNSLLDLTIGVGLCGVMLLFDVALITRSVKARARRHPTMSERR